jgi:predicted nucleotidyltransferase
MRQERQKYDIDLPNAQGCEFTEKLPFIRDFILDVAPPNSIRKIYLFGSYAYGEPDEDSDIDICIIINNKLSENKYYSKYFYEFAINKIYPSDVFVFTEKNFENGERFRRMKETIKQKGKLLYG